mmetsp:Transcript_2719/g.7961  ORF Transcript_2719/g.7961 Transcript_2719/m.7961 type:complete len:292 (-) Transcript_2719:547-1422(-)|eukprot:CAMPEP_0118877186 /NCGR_PEP_ID=MMETSP1163-20130328/17576_1 /TAXON_ID=124430 /ORGANISM="Phaeomonas parva, Strain CCMP2877" /LENGTH=291 /DNA_ID=CAMNT_0006812875 /DNA_START=17 /DNA_END=892 /DNA_ORIENTATION=+
MASQVDAADSATASQAFGVAAFNDEEQEDDDSLGPGEETDLAARFADMSMEYVSAREVIYNEAFADHDVHVGKAVSKKERDDTGQKQSTLVYGEIRFDSFCLALMKVKNKYGLPGEGATGPDGIMQGTGTGIFYDIGSGTGKPTVAAAIAHPFEKAYGIEILEGLYNESVIVKGKWDGGIKKDAGHDTEVIFVHGDITNFDDHDWSDGDVCFANSTCFDETLMRSVAEKAAYMKRGSFFITLTKRLPGKDFQVLESELHQMSWGGATVFIQQKVTDRYDPAAEDATSSTQT